MTILVLGLPQILRHNQFQPVIADIGLDTPTEWGWNTTTVVSTESSLGSLMPSLAVDSANNLYVAWFDHTDYGGSGTDPDIFLKKFDTQTWSWQTSEIISTDSTGNSFEPSIAVDNSDNIHIVWEDETDYGGSGTDLDIFYKRFDSQTQTWGMTVVVSTESSAPSRAASITVDSMDNLHVVWYDATDYNSAGTDNDIFYKKFDNSTSLWGTTVVISTESTLSSIFPSIAVDVDKNLHVAWADSTDYDSAGTDVDIFYKTYDNLISSWQSSFVISTESTLNSDSQSIVVDSNNNIHVVWEDDSTFGSSGSDTDIFYKTYASDISSWLSTEVISTESTSLSSTPVIAVDDENDLHVIWVDYTNFNGAGSGPDVFYRQYDSQTSSWGGTLDISRNTGSSSLGDIEVDHWGFIQTVWYDTTDYDGAGNDADIFHRQYSGTPEAPILNEIIPNPTDGFIDLSWKKVYGASHYNIYGDIAPIHDLSVLTPIGMTENTYFIDHLSTEGNYFYVVTANNVLGESKASNMQVVNMDLDSNSNTNTVTTTIVSVTTQTTTLQGSSNGGLPLFPLSIVIPGILAVAIMRRKFM